MRTGTATIALLLVVALGVVATGLAATPAVAQDSSNETIVEVRLAGTTAEDVTVDNATRVRTAVAAELGIAADRVAVVDADGSTALEVQTGGVSTDELTSALSAAGVSTEGVTVRAGVTAQTRQRAATIIDGRLNVTSEYNGSVEHIEATRLFVRVTGDPPRAVLERLVQRGDVTVTVRTPSGETARLLTNSDIRQTKDVLDGENASGVPVRLTEDGARHFSEELRRLNFTDEDEGVNACEGRPAPNATGYCLVTELNGEVVSTAGVNQPLARAVEFGTFTENELLGIVAGNDTEARAARLGMLSIPIATDTTIVGVGVELPANGTTPTPTGGTATTSGSSGPGFTPVVAVLALLAGALLAARASAE